LQSYQPKDILVINNGSTDNTVKMLKSRCIPFLSQENLGSAGGWRSGIQYAIDFGFDAAWLMDDDGYPERDALRALSTSLVPGVACASSVVMREEQPTHFVFPFPILDGKLNPVIYQWPQKLHTLADLNAVAPKGTYPYAHFFNGALICIDTAKKIGNVNKDFFIFGDEIDYFFRLRKAGEVISVLGAIHYHPDVSRRPYTPMKVYYYVKNTLVLNSRYLNSVWLRHFMTIIIVLVRTANRNGVLAAFSFLLGNNAGIFYRAIYRGLSGEIGKDFNG
jgi:GT2 family glycosyltransferase